MAKHFSAFPSLCKAAAVGSVMDVAGEQSEPSCEGHSPPGGQSAWAGLLSVQLSFIWFPNAAERAASCTWPVPCPGREAWCCPDFHSPRRAVRARVKLHQGAQMHLARVAPGTQKGKVRSRPVGTTRSVILGLPRSLPHRCLELTLIHSCKIILGDNTLH